MDKKISTIFALVVVAVVALFFGGLFLFNYQSEKKAATYEEQYVQPGSERNLNVRECTAEARPCTDGTAVGRNPLNNCEFDPCPEESTSINQNLLDPNDQNCEADDDCRIALTECGCSCSGVPINKKYIDKYNEAQAKKCGNTAVCDMLCEPPVLECQSGKCINVSSSIDTSDWKTYRNEEYGFELTYPKELIIQENTEQFEKMCQAEFKLESESNDFTNTRCVDDNFVTRISNYDGYCTKGGCVGKNLKPYKIEEPIFAIHIGKISVNEKNKLLSERSSEFNVSYENINGIDTYYYVVDDIYPTMYGFFSSKKQTFMILNATETGSRENEDKEIEILRKVFTTLKRI